MAGVASMNEPANHEAVFDAAGNTHVRIDEAPKGRPLCWYQIDRNGRVVDVSGPWYMVEMIGSLRPASAAQANQAVQRILAYVGEHPSEAEACRAARMRGEVGR